MKKTSNLMYIGGMLLFIISILAQNSYAQKSVKTKIDEPQKQAKKSFLQTYIDISALSMNDRRAAFIDLSSEDKAGIFKFHLAFQFVKRANLTKEQKDLILESIGSISTDTYDFTKDRTGAQAMAKNIEIRAAPLFSKQEIFEIFASIGANKADTEMLQNYASLSTLSGPDRKELFAGQRPMKEQIYGESTLGFIWWNTLK